MNKVSHTLDFLRCHIKKVLSNLETGSMIKLMIVAPLILEGGYILLRILEMWWTPPGSSTRDGISHLLFALLIRDRLNPWIPYSLFPQLYSSSSLIGPFPNAYPSMSDAILSLVVATGLDPLLSMKISVSTTFCLGLIAYFLVFQDFTKNRILSLGGVLFLIICFGRELQTFHDGSFGELLAIMVLFPVSVYSITNSKWIESAICVPGILYSHNLSSVAAVLPILTLYAQAIVTKKDQRKSILESVLLIVLLSLPILVTYYAPTLLNLSQGTAGTSDQLGLSLFPLDDPNTWLIALGCLAAVFVTFCFKKKALWIDSWLGGMFLLSMTDIFPGRVVRALSLPSSIMLYLAMATLLTAFLEEPAFDDKRVFPVMRMRIRELVRLKSGGRAMKSGKKVLTGAIAVSIFLLPICLGFFELSVTTTSPTTLDFWDAKKAPVYQNLRNLLSPDDAVVIVDDYWARYFLYPFTVLKIVSSSSASRLNYYDRIVNEAILSSLNGSLIDGSINGNISTEANLEARYVILSSPMNDRWYPNDEVDLIGSLSEDLETNPSVAKIVDTNSSDGWIRVYELLSPIAIPNVYQHTNDNFHLAISSLLFVGTVATLFALYFSQRQSSSKIDLRKMPLLFPLLIVIWFWFTFILQ